MPSTTSTASALLASSLLLFLSFSRADKEAFYASSQYNNADYGDYVTQDFVSSPVRAPWVNFNKPFSACDDGSYYFVAPRGNVADATPYILDAEGSLIWAPDEHYGEVYNFWVQKYKGEDYLTFWSGDDSIGGHGEGTYHMLDRHYEEYRLIEGANGIGADLHSFTITSNNTATCSLYDIHQVDLTDVRPEDPEGYVWDSLFQELDIETGEALFEWRASDHFNFTESYLAVNSATQMNPWDFFHINAVDKDDLGNYLISSRFMRTIAYVSGTNGEVLWKLGGKENSFHDLSDGLATQNVGQHDCRWTADHSAVTFFDNRGDWYYQADTESWGSRVRLDLDKMTAELEATYKNPAGIYSFSQGSYQTLPNGNVMIGYGFVGAFTEFTPDGEALCDAYLQPRARFGSGDVQSYRNMKFNWTGIPKTTPSLVYQEKNLFMSWKGSTETRRWLLQHASRRDSDAFADLKQVDKAGFETRVSLAHGLCTKEYLRVIALDAQGRHLATSLPIQLEDAREACATQWRQSVDENHGASQVPSLNSNKNDDDNNHQPASSFSSSSTYSNHPPTSSAAAEDWTSELEDLQLLFAFGLVALLSGSLVAYYMCGTRAFTQCFRGRGLLSSHSRSVSSSSASTSPNMRATRFPTSYGRIGRLGQGVSYSVSDFWEVVRSVLPGSLGGTGSRRGTRWWDGEMGDGGGMGGRDEMRQRHRSGNSEGFDEDEGLSSEGDGSDGVGFRETKGERADGAEGEVVVG